MATTVDVHGAVSDRLGALEQRYTHGRRLIVETLLDAATPLTLPEILARTTSLTQSSTYRNLGVMESANVVRRLMHGGEHAHFELAEDLTTHHHHLICERCGLILDISLDRRLERSLDTAFDRLAGSYGFRVDRHVVDVYGLCDDCAQLSAAV